MSFRLLELRQLRNVVPNDHHQSIFEHSALLRFSVLSAISLAIWFRPLVSSFALSLRNDQYTHIVLIIPLSITLLLLKSKTWRAPRTHFSVMAGILVLTLAVTMAVVAQLRFVTTHADERLAIEMLALVFWWNGSFIVCFGIRSFQHSIFPLLFLLWLVPIPEFVLNPIIRVLQEGSATSVAWLFAAFGVPVAQDRTLITIPGLTLEVARECSSIRSSLMLVVTTMFLAQILLKSSWKKTFVIAAAVPLSVAKNGLRIFVLGMAATHIDRSYLDGRLHHDGGIIYFVIALGVISVLLWIARRSDHKPRLSSVAQ